MPVYVSGQPTTHIYPGSNAYLVGQKAVPGIPNAFGTVTTSGSTVTRVSGLPFDAGMAGQTITINGSNYTVNTVNVAAQTLSTTTTVGTNSTAVPYSFPSYNKFASEQYESISASYISQSVNVAPVFGMHGYQGRQITWELAYSGTITTVTAQLQGANSDPSGDFNWDVVDTSTNTSGESRTVNSNYHHFRVVFTVLTGSGELAIVRLRCM